ncbi:MAG: PhzF family phenazine biosynthesis protein [Anaerolineales bacterium]
MAEAAYTLVDVFTHKPFGGNPLAVFMGASALEGDIMQTLAKELNLSESVFVLPPLQETSDYRLRIFTPAREMPMAGHPTVGAAFALVQAGLLGPENPTRNTPYTYHFDEGVGVIPVEVLYGINQDDLMITMEQPLPSFADPIAARADMAALLSLDADDIHPDLPVQVVSTGVPFTFIPLRSLDAVKRAVLRHDIWSALLKDTDAPDVFLFTPQAEDDAHSVHSRMFAPSLGIPEDPATGAASGPLGCYLVRHGVVSTGPQVQIISEQGYEMGRPSLIHITITSQGDEISRVRVGGHCVLMGEGRFYLPE